MLRILRQGTGWIVFREGKIVKEGRHSGVHPNQDAAVRHAIRLAAETGDLVEPRVWTRHHSNGLLAEVALTEDGALAWHAPVGIGTPTSALDIDEARKLADAAIRASGHECSPQCGSW